MYGHTRTHSCMRHTHMHGMALCALWGLLNLKYNLYATAHMLPAHSETPALLCAPWPVHQHTHASTRPHTHAMSCGTFSDATVACYVVTCHLSRLDGLKVTPAVQECEHPGTWALSRARSRAPRDSFFFACSRERPRSSPQAGRGGAVVFFYLICPVRVIALAYQMGRCWHFAAPGARQPANARHGHHKAGAWLQRIAQSRPGKLATPSKAGHSPRGDTSTAPAPPLHTGTTWGMV